MPVQEKQPVEKFIPALWEEVERRGGIKDNYRSVYMESRPDPLEQIKVGDVFKINDEKAGVTYGFIKCDAYNFKILWALELTKADELRLRWPHHEILHNPNLYLSLSQQYDRSELKVKPFIRIKNANNLEQSWDLPYDNAEHWEASGKFFPPFNFARRRYQQARTRAAMGLGIAAFSGFSMLGVAAGLNANPPTELSAGLAAVCCIPPAVAVAGFFAYGHYIHIANKELKMMGRILTERIPKLDGYFPK